MPPHSSLSMLQPDRLAAAEELARQALQQEDSLHLAPPMRPRLLTSETLADRGVGAQTRPAQRWTSIGDDIVSLSNSPLPRGPGTTSLAVHARGTGYAALAVLNPQLRGTTFELQVFIPASSAIEWLQPFLLADQSGDWRWTSQWFSAADLQRDTWQHLVLQIPAHMSLWATGLEFYVTRPTYTTMYLAEGSN